MFEIIFLGTSASAPSVHRGLSAQIIKHDEHRFLIDCGEGTQRQILKSGIGFKRLNRILITHSHLDHILGLGGLLSTFMRWEIVDELEIIGGRYALERIYELLMKVVLRGTRPPVDLRFREIQPGLIFDEKNFWVEAFPVRHRGPDCYGYIFQEKPRRPFLVEKAEKLGVPPGPWRRELVNGTAINLPDGRTIHPDEVLGEEKPGTRIVHVGDTGHTEDLLPYAKGADVLVIEATYLQSEVDMARKFAHLTAKQSAELARDAGVGFLILTHISRRYRERDVLEEAQSVFPKTRVARDFDTVQVKRGSVELKSG
ncbi:MAG TPA: ribonuclease Z [Anaerolineae bacterium]|nr:ribonuclease Z [Anaerolineae bacterium]